MKLIILLYFLSNKNSEICKNYNLTSILYRNEKKHRSRKLENEQKCN
jgi:hypothetical protein